MVVRNSEKHAHVYDCGIQDMVPKLCPVQIAAHRQGELMAIVTTGEFEDAEWVDEDLADFTGVDVPVETAFYVEYMLNSPQAATVQRRRMSSGVPQPPGSAAS